MNLKTTTGFSFAFGFTVFNKLAIHVPIEDDIILIVFIFISIRWSGTFVLIAPFPVHLSDVQMMSCLHKLFQLFHGTSNRPPRLPKY